MIDFVFFSSDYKHFWSHMSSCQGSNINEIKCFYGWFGLGVTQKWVVVDESEISIHELSDDGCFG